MTGRSGQIIAEFTAPGPEPGALSLSRDSIRRCSLCLIRKVLGRGFYRDRKSRGGYRRECKKCRNRARARWARLRYRPKTGRRYRTRAGRDAEAHSG